MNFTAFLGEGFGSSLKGGWGIGLGFLLFVIFLFCVIMVKRKRAKKEDEITPEDIPHIHDWETIGYLVLRDKYPRLIKECKECGLSMHVPIYTKKILKEYGYE